MDFLTDMMKKLLAIALFFTAISHANAAEPTATVVDFNGELVDQNAAPISGVLPLEFRVYTEEKSKKAIATEKHFISVVDGAYAITLGESSELKTTKTDLYVAVLLDGKELTRQKASVQKQIVAAQPTKTTSKTAEDAAENNAFKLECPTGYVMTGVEGSLNDIRTLKVICSKTI